jgi:hypothetical protein
LASKAIAVKLLGCLLYCTEFCGSAVQNHKGRLSFDRPRGGNYIVLKSGTSISLDLDGGALNISLGSKLLSYGNFTGNANGWSFNDPYWSYSTNTMVKDGDGTGTLSQPSDGVYPLALTAGAVCRLGYTTSSFTVGDSGEIL